MNQARTIYIEDVSGSRLLWCRIIESENAQRRTKVFKSISNRFARINRSHFRAQFVRVHCALCIHRERERGQHFIAQIDIVFRIQCKRLFFIHNFNPIYLPMCEHKLHFCCTHLMHTTNGCAQSFPVALFPCGNFLFSKRLEEVEINRHKSVIPNGTQTLRAGFKLRVKVKMHTKNRGKQLSKKLMESRYEIS